MAGQINRVDHTETVTASGNSDVLDSSGMGQLSTTYNLTAISGSGAYIQFELQASDDGSNWTPVHDTRRMTTVDIQRLSGVRISSKWYRHVWFVGGTSPSCAFTITTTIKDYSPGRTLSLFRYNDLDLKTLSATSTQFGSGANSEIGCMIVRATDTSTAVSLKIQASQDALTWNDVTGDFTVASNETVQRDFTGNSLRFMRVIVATAATGGSTSTATILWNATGGT